MAIFKWSDVPTESEMSPENFGPEQILLFLNRIVHDIFMGSRLRKSGGPTIKISKDENDVISVNGDKIYRNKTECKSPRVHMGWIHQYTEDGQQKIVGYSNPFDLFQSVVCRIAKRELTHWELVNYACIA